MERTWLISISIVALIVVLTGAAFFGAQLAGSESSATTSEPGVVVAADAGSIDDGAGRELASTGSDDEPEKPPKKKGGARARVMELSMDDGSGPVSVRITIEPSPDLPDRPAEASGVFVRRDDNSIIVGTGAVELNLEITQTQGGALEPQISLSTSGPEIEVVVTHDTTIYREETEMPSPGKSGEKTVQQVVRPVDSLDELGKNTELQVWGRKTGDRVVAEVLVYRIVTPDGLF